MGVSFTEIYVKNNNNPMKRTEKRVTNGVKTYFEMCQGKSNGLPFRYIIIDKCFL